jgi:hypothetical protein
LFLTVPGKVDVCAIEETRNEETGNVFVNIILRSGPTIIVVDQQ